MHRQFQKAGGGARLGERAVAETEVPCEQEQLCGEEPDSFGGVAGTQRLHAAAPRPRLQDPPHGSRRRESNWRARAAADEDAQFVCHQVIWLLS